MSIVNSAFLLATCLAPAASAADSSFIFVDLTQTETRTLPSKITLRPQTTCPVTGKPIDKKLFVDYNGKRIYVCCPDYLAQVRKKPAKYIKKLTEMRQGVETVLFTDDGKKTTKKRIAQPGAGTMAK